jgi:[ribosomal protein S5]-alanine N-acetyltransferase
MLELNFHPFPTIQTERLILRKITLEDAPEFFKARSAAESMKYIGKPLHKSVLETEDLIKLILEGLEANTSVSWVISLKDNPKFIGNIGYHRIAKEHYRAEVGYMVLPEYWNKRIVKEALKAVLDFGFTKMNLHSIEAKINPHNIASRKLLTGAGFEKEAYFKEDYFFEGKFQDTEIYSLLNKVVI